MKKIIILFAGVFVLTSTAAQTPIQKFFTEADAFFKKHVSDGLVDYSAVKNNPSSLKLLIKKIESLSVKDERAEVKKAFYINAYNLIVINGIVDNYPVKTPQSINGFFEHRPHSVAGARLTLNDIVNKKLRAEYSDPRIHFAVVNGAMGAPHLMNSAYFPDSLDQQLDAKLKSEFNNPSIIRVNEGDQTVSLPQLFNWFEKDFVTGGMSIIQFINRYREPRIPSEFKKEYYTFDWQLNEKKKLKPSPVK